MKCWPHVLWGGLGYATPLLNTGVSSVKPCYRISKPLPP
ncbi:Uncharacterised protein [Vibrio cholerae]|nr:Uncharacterised protein [Vibrio cholerae]